MQIAKEGQVSLFLVAGNILVLLAAIFAVVAGYKSGAQVARHVVENRRQLSDLMERYDIQEEDKETLLRLARSVAEEENPHGTPSYSNPGLVTVAALGGVFGLVVLVIVYWERLVTLISAASFVGVAAASDAASSTTKADISWMMPWLLLSILGVIAIAFLGAIVVLLTTKDTPEHQSKLKASADIVKTFGGFFTGIATTALSGALG